MLNKTSGKLDQIVEVSKGILYCVNARKSFQWMLGEGLHFDFMAHEKVC